MLSLLLDDYDEEGEEEKELALYPPLHSRDRAVCNLFPFLLPQSKEGIFVQRLFAATSAFGHVISTFIVSFNRWGLWFCAPLIH